MLWQVFGCVAFCLRLAISAQYTVCRVSLIHCNLAEVSSLAQTGPVCRCSEDVLKFQTKQYTCAVTVSNLPTVL